MPITQKDRKTIMIGSIIAIVVILFFNLRSIWKKLNEANVKLPQTISQYEKYVLYQKYNIPASREKTEKDLTELYTYFYTTESLDNISLQLLEIIETTALEQNITWSKEELIPIESKEGQYPKIMVQVTGNCGIEQLAKLIDKLENYNKFLWVDQLLYEKRDDTFNVRLTLATIYPYKVLSESEGRIN